MNDKITVTLTKPRPQSNNRTQNFFFFIVQAIQHGAYIKCSMLILTSAISYICYYTIFTKKIMKHPVNKFCGHYSFANNST